MQIETKELSELLAGNRQSPIATSPSCEEYHGTNIVILDRGWVYVGKVTTGGEWVTIENARNIRNWGTKNGLGELIHGPTGSTKMDSCGTVKASRKALIHMIKCSRDW